MYKIKEEKLNSQLCVVLHFLFCWIEIKDDWNDLPSFSCHPVLFKDIILSLNNISCAV